MIPERIASIVAISSSAPEAPSAWPCMLLVDDTGRRPAWAPKTRFSDRGLGAAGEDHHGGLADRMVRRRAGARDRHDRPGQAEDDRGMARRRVVDQARDGEGMQAILLQPVEPMIVLLERRHAADAAADDRRGVAAAAIGERVAGARHRLAAG